MTQINSLSPDNFLSVADVSMDILEALQMTSNNIVVIPLIRKVVRYSNLLPASSPDLIDRYGSFRLKALEYLKTHNHIETFQLLRDDPIHWDCNIEVEVAIDSFNKFYDEFEGVYQKRVVDPQIKEKGKEKMGKSKISDFSYSKDDEIIFREQKSKMPSNTNQSEICKYMFNQPITGDWISWETVFESIQGVALKNKSRVIYDAVEDINTKTLADIGLKVMEFRDKKIRINPRFF